MRKLIVLAGIALTAASAYGATSIVGSKHDLSSASTATIKSNNYDEVCVFCHTPHGASTSVTNAPLWNRTNVSLASMVATDLYNSTTLETASKPSTTLANVKTSDAPLCFACHDGASLADGLVNPANSANNAQPTGMTATSMNTANLLDGTNSLKNDHPIGMNYSVAAAAEQADTKKQGLKASATTTLNFYNGIMWCSSCHDVHNPQYSPFLAADNRNSGLCLTCHQK